MMIAAEKQTEKIHAIERDMLRAKIFRLLGLIVRRRPEGGFVVSLPPDPGGYPGGREIEPGVWHFRRRKDAFSATLYAADKARDE